MNRLIRLSLCHEQITPCHGSFLFRQSDLDHQNFQNQFIHDCSIMANLQNWSKLIKVLNTFSNYPSRIVLFLLFSFINPVYEILAYPILLCF